MKRGHIAIFTVCGNRKDIKIEEKIKILQKDKHVSNKVKERIIEFEENFKGDNLLWFKEMCFCLLTANFLNYQNF